MVEKKSKEKKEQEKKEKDAERKRKKSGVSKSATDSKQAKVLLDVGDAGYATGYETDGGASISAKRKPKSRKKSKTAGDSGGGEAGYETDDGYMSTPGRSKTKRFFRLGNRSKSNVDLDEQPKSSVDEVPPPMPVFHLPIAARFATTLGNLNAGATVDPPVVAPVDHLPPLQPFIRTDTAISNPASASSSPVSRTPAEDGRDSVEASKPPNAHGPSSATKRKMGIRFGSSDSSDPHGSTSTGHSVFSKFTTSSAVSSPPSSANSMPAISFPLTRELSPPSSHSPTAVTQNYSPVKSAPKRVPDPLSLAPQGSKLNTGLSRSASPSGGAASSPTSSPFVVLTPTDPSAPAPSEPNPTTRPQVRFLPKKVEGLIYKSSPAKTPKTTIPSSSLSGKCFLISLALYLLNARSSPQLVTPVAILGQPSPWLPA